MYLDDCLTDAELAEANAEIRAEAVEPYTDEWWTVRPVELRERFGSRLDTVSGLLGVIAELTQRFETARGYVPPF
jgi:hypothetical protein